MTREELLSLSNTARFDEDSAHADAARQIFHDALLEFLPEYTEVLNRAAYLIRTGHAKTVRVVVDPERLFAILDEAPRLIAMAFRIDTHRDGYWIADLGESDLVTFVLSPAARDARRRRR